MAAVERARAQRCVRREWLAYRVAGEWAGDYFFIVSAISLVVTAANW